MEILYKNVENEFKAKEEAFWEFKDWILLTKCNSYNKTLKQTINLAKQMYNDSMIGYHKREIRRVFGGYFLNLNKSAGK